MTKTYSYDSLEDGDDIIFVQRKIGIAVHAICDIGQE
jgi:hypothetical protein